MTSLLLGLGAIAILIIVLLLKPKPRPLGVSIDTPHDLSIQVCNREVTFRAHTTPPGHESEIRWEVPLDQFQTNASGTGPAFTTSWTETGLKQVVARFRRAADDVILFVYKTASGRATLGDILESSPPPVSRRPRDYRCYRLHQFPNGLES